MSNYFDQFDKPAPAETAAQSAQPEQGNFFDQYDEPAAPKPQKPASPYAYGRSAPEDKNQDGIADYLQVQSEPGIFSDIWTHASSAFLDSFAGDAEAGHIVTGNEWLGEKADDLAESAEGMREGLSKDAREAGSKKWANSNDDILYNDASLFGEAWGDIDSWAGLIGSAAGSLGAVVGGGGITKIGATVGLRVTARKLGTAVAQKAALKKTAKDKGSEAARAQLEQFKRFNEQVERAVGATSYGVAEAGMVGGSVARDVEAFVMEMPLETLKQAPLFQETYWELVDAEGMSHQEAFDQAQKVTARILATQGMANAAIPSLLLGSVAGKYLDDALTGKMQGTRLQRGTKAALSEGVTESGQGATEHLGAETAKQKADPSIDPFNDLANAAISEGLGGSLAGGGLGLISRTPDEIEQQEVRDGGQAASSADQELDRMENEGRREAAAAEAAKRQLDVANALAGVNAAAAEGGQGTTIPVAPREPSLPDDQQVPTLMDVADVPEGAAVGPMANLVRDLEIEAQLDPAEGDIPTLTDTYSVPTLMDPVIADEYQDGPGERVPRGEELDLPERYKQVEKQGLSRRFADPGYRFELEQMASSLAHGGHGASHNYTFDERGNIDGRMGSVNPEWFQKNGDMKSVAYVKNVVGRALQGGKLGKREKRVIEAMMDVVDDLNGEFGQEWGEYGAFDPDNGTLFTRAADGSVRFNPQDGAGARTYAMLEEEARDAGVPNKLIEALHGRNLPLPQHAEALYEATQRAKRRAAQQGGNQAGAPEVSRTQESQEEASGTADAGEGSTPGGRSEPAGVEPDKSEPIRSSGVERLKERMAKEKEEADKLWYNKIPEARKYADKWKPTGDTAKKNRKLETEQRLNWRAGEGVMPGGSLERFQELEAEINANLKEDFDQYMSEYEGPGSAKAKQAEIEAAANEANTKPSLLQKEAGNYKKGRIEVHGIKIGIENPAGSKRSGVGTDGRPWEVTLTHHYGDITGVEGADGDQLDVFVNSEGDPEEATHVFIVDQIDDDGNFDEHKVLMGFSPYKAARKAYLEQYDDKFRGKHGPIEAMTVADFKDWLENGDKTKPLHWSLRSRRNDEKQHNVYKSRINDAKVHDANHANLDNIDLDTAKKLIADLRTELNTSERTGLGSNRAWINRKPKVFTASIDVDSLKWVNDNMGHQSGDQMLKLVADAMRAVGLGDDAFHISGDEFYAHGDDAIKLRAKLREALKWLQDKTITAEGVEFTGPGFSFGIAEDLEDAEIRLSEQKRGRERTGKRAGRGQQPRGVVKTGGSDNRSGGSEIDSAQAAGNEESTSEEVLSSYTEEDLQRREEEQERLNREEADRIERGEADAERDNFTLTGSNLPADVAAAQGQNSLFDAGGEASDPIQDFIDGKRPDAPTVEEVEAKQKPKRPKRDNKELTPALAIRRSLIREKGQFDEYLKLAEELGVDHSYNILELRHAKAVKNGEPVNFNENLPVARLELLLKDIGFLKKDITEILYGDGSPDAIFKDGIHFRVKTTDIKVRFVVDPVAYEIIYGERGAIVSAELTGDNVKGGTGFKSVAGVTIEGWRESQLKTLVERLVIENTTEKGFAYVLPLEGLESESESDLLTDEGVAEPAEQMRDGDIGTKSGKPFKTTAAANAADKREDYQLSANRDLVEVEGGFVWRDSETKKAAEAEAEESSKAEDEEYEAAIRSYLKLVGVKGGTVADLQRADVDYLFAHTKAKYREGLAAYIADAGVEVSNAMQWAVKDASGLTRADQATFQGKSFEDWKNERTANNDQLDGEANGNEDAPAPKAKPKRSKNYGSKNKLVSQERAEELRKQLLAELGTLNSGLNPKIMAIGAELAVFHLEAGARKFVDLANAIADDLGVEVQKLKPYLRGWYNNARDMMEDSDLDVSDMDGPDQVKAGLKELMETPADADKGDIADYFGERLDSMRDNRGVKAAMSQYLDIPQSEVTGEHMKQAQEAIEVALVRRARETLRKGGEEQSVYRELVGQYMNQPNLNVRSSTSMERQAYSTPAPIAMVASQLAGIDTFSKVYEPTAGNGMLLIGADIDSADANELTPERAANLRKLGFSTTQNDASEWIPAAKAYDAVIMNPPFGNITDAEGDKVTVEIDGYTIKKIDHLIAARALDAMKDDGKAVIIIGADRDAGKIGPGDRVFFNWLYSNYNVADHFEIDGDLYKRQGAGWPIRVIVVDGRQESNRLSPKTGTIERLEDWDQIYDRYNETKGKLDSSGPRTDGQPATGAESGSSTSEPAGTARPARGESAGPAGSGNTGRKNGGNGSRPGKPANDNGDGGRAGSNGDATGAGRPVQGNRGNVQPETEQASPANPGADTGSKKPDTAKPNGSVSGKSRVEGGASSFQATYKARSNGFNESVLTPKNMAEATERALATIEEAVGDIDQYVADKLQYPSIEALHKAFMGLQVDTVAAAIFNIENRDRGIIIADQTGVGKGRQAAAMIRYAQLNGYTPVFMTVKPNLYSDMYGDSIDIGNTDLKPFITNQGEAVIHNEQRYFDLKPAARKSVQQHLTDNGDLPKGYNAVFTTYDQLKQQGAKENPRRTMLSHISRPLYILDESHNASGAFTKDAGRASKKKKQELTTAGFVSERLKDNPVVYLSATYAKRPDNMPIYHRTDLLDAVDSQEQLVEAMSAGGVPLQQVAATMLAENGQLFRRERSFEGINIPVDVDTNNVKEQERISDDVNAALRAVVDASDVFVNYWYEEFGKDFTPDGGDVRVAGNRADNAAGTANPFTSVVHNYIRQLLLGLKVEKAAKHAVELHKAGKKPVIAFENTLGSFLSDYVERNGLKEGDRVDFSYTDIMLVALERSRRLSFKDAQGKSKPRTIELHELDPLTAGAYREAEKKIRAIDLSALPASPVDYWLNHLEENGVKVGEITGRGWRIDYSGKHPTLKRRSEKEKRARRELVDGFNSGSVDALLLNVAGSTGLSIHASEKFTDDKPRHMIVAQAMLDINILMQMLGRINRTGQVELPEYTLMSLALPAEKRPMANTASKLAMLNANTSANDKSDNSFDAPDFLNKYGDQVVNDWMKDNPDVRAAVRMNTVDEEKAATPGTASKFTGRLALLDVATQRRVYDEILQAYNDKIEYLNATGQNDLVAQVLDMDAFIEESKIVHEGKDPKSIFAGHTTLHKVNAKYLGKPPLPEDVSKAIDDALDGNTPQGFIEAELGRLSKDTKAEQSLRQRLETHEQRLNKAQSAIANDDGSGDPEKLQKAVDSANSDYDSAHEALQTYKSVRNEVQEALATRFLIGSRHRLDISDELVTGVVTGIKLTHKEGVGSPWAKSKVQVTFMVNSGVRQLTVPMTQLLNKKDPLYIEKLMGSGKQGLEDVFNPALATAERRETRYIATGNLIAGMAKLSGGKIAMFTDRDGRQHQGVLMPRKFDKKLFEGGNAVNNMVVRDPVALAKYLQIPGTPAEVGAFDADRKVKIHKGRQGYTISLPKANKNPLHKLIKFDDKLRGIVGDFYGAGTLMFANVPDGKLQQAVERLMELVPLNIASSQREHWESVGGAPAPEAVKSFDGSTLQNTEAPEAALDIAEATPAPAEISAPVPGDAAEAAPQGRATPEQVEELTGVAALKPSNMNSKHTKTGKWLYVVNFGADMGDHYDAINRLAKKHGGFYIRARMRNYYKPATGGQPQGTPTFTFESQSDREKFRQELKFALAESEDVRYRLGSGGNGSVTPLQARTRTSKLEREIGIPVQVVKDENALPQRIADQIDRQGARGKVRGLYDQRTGKAYVIADNLKSADEAATVYLHEVVGHMGLRAALGKQLDIVLTQIHRDMPADVRASLAWKHRRQLESESPRRQALILADEYVAHLAETDPKNGMIDKVVSVVRRWLRKLGFVKGWTRADIVDLIAQGRERLRNGGSRGTADGVRYAMKATRDQLQFKQLRTKQGHPVWRNDEVVIHGDRKLDNLAADLPMGHEAHVPDDVEAWHMTAYSDGKAIADLSVQVKGGRIVGVHNIDSKAPGAGEKVIASLLANNRGGLQVVEAVPEAQGFWSKMGANGFFDQYRNTFITWSDYEQNRQKRAAEAGKRRGDGGVQLGGVLPQAAAPAGRKADSGRAQEPGSSPENEPLDPQSREWLDNFNLRFSLDDGNTEELYEKLGLGRKPSKLRKLVDAIRTANLRDAWDSLKLRSYEGIFDGLVGIKRAEDAVGKGIAANDYAGSGYVGARLATGTADLMTAILQYGSPKWGEGGVIEHQEGTEGLLEIFAELGDDLRDWLAWMGGMRGRELMRQGRENNLTEEDIAALIDPVRNNPEKLAKFRRVQQKYAGMNKAMLDLAEGAGLIDSEGREKWESQWYIPFYRQDFEGNGLMGPRTKRGLSHQSSGIKALRGGETATNDLLENIMTNWLKLADASVKNMALLKTVDNLQGTDYLTNESLKFKPALVTKREMIQRVKDNYEFAEEMRALLAAYNGDVEEALIAQNEEGYTPPRDPMMVEAVLEELESMDQAGIEQMWALTAPAEPDIVRVKRDGKSEYYRVNDPALLRGLVHLSAEGNNGMLMKAGRAFKRLLTTGVTAAPDFMLRNFVRDAAHAWAINKDGFRFGLDSLKSLKGAFEQDEDYRELMFAMASFQGGYVHGTDPEAGADLIRRTLTRKGMSPSQINNHLDSIVGYAEAGWDKWSQAWQKYRTMGDRLENTNRLATFKAAKKAGKSLAQAVFESKDLMDYSLRGNWAAMNVLTDLVPFMNARLQGLSKLARAAELKGEPLKPWTWGMDPQMGAALLKIALASMLLAWTNTDEPEYEALPDWEKDAYWHVFLDGQHFRVPKPFEIGIVAGTIPERMAHAWVFQTQPSEKVMWSLQHGVMETLNFNPTPQAILPIFELWGNRSMYFDTPIESVSDKRKLPRDRYNGFTSDSAVWLGQMTGMSPKQLEHVWNGYTGTMGAYALASTDMLVRWMQDKPNRGLLGPRDVPVVRSFYRGERPPHSTQWTTDLYDRLKEATQLAGSFKEIDDPIKRRAFLKEYGDKLSQRRTLEATSSTLSRLRKQRDRILEQDIPARQKQVKLDAIQKKINEAARRASDRTAEAWR